MEEQAREKETTVRVVTQKEELFCMLGQCGKHSRTINIRPRNLVSHLGLLLFAPKF